MSTPSPAARLGRIPAAAARPRPAFIAQGALAGGTIAIYLVVLVSAGLHQQDLSAYLQGGHDVLAGRPLYATFLQHPFPDPTLRPAFIYPPVFALLMAPLAVLPPSLAAGLWMVLNQAALIGAVLLAIRWLRPSGWALTAILAATATFYPLWIDVVQGQANLLILLLVVAGMIGVLAERERLTAAWGVAAAVKVSPALLLPWLLIERRWRAVAWAAGGFAALTMVGMVARVNDTITFFSRVLPALAGGTAVYANQSVSGFVLRVSSVNRYTDPWLALGRPLFLIAAIAVLLVAWWAWRTYRADAQTRLLVFIPLIPLLSSVTWPHHLVLLLPVFWATFAMLGRRGWPFAPTASTVGLLLAFSVLTRVPAGPAFGAPGFRAAQTAEPIVLLAANGFLLGTVLLYFASPWLLRSR